MNRIKSLIGCCSLLVGMSACNSGDDNSYVPDPSRGDFVVVKEMVVLSSDEGVQKADKYIVEYNALIAPKMIKIFTGEDLEVLQDVEDASYEFNYNDRNLLVSIHSKQKGNVSDDLVASYNVDGLSGFKGQDYEIKYLRSKGNIVEATKKDEKYNFEYNYLGNLISIKGENQDVTLDYGNGVNPFVNNGYNLLLGYFPGGDLIELVQSSKNNITNITDNKTGKVYRCVYEWDQFNYPITLTVSLDDQIVRKFMFKNAIYRLNSEQ